MKTHFENIDPWFENARSQDPVISREEVLNQLQSGATGAGKGISSGSTLYIFSAAGLLLIVICGVLFFSPKYNSETLPPASGQESEKIGTKRPVNGDSITSAINEPEKSKSGFYYSPVDADPLFLLRDTYIKDERFRPANSEITIPAQEESIKKHVRNKPQEYLNLSYSDLENLGIYTNGHVLKYRNITDSIIEADGSKKYLYMNIDVEPHGSISYNINDEVKNQAEFSNSRPFRPLFVVSLIDTQLIKVDFLVREIYDEAYFDVTHEYLVPVNVKLNPAPGKSGPFSHSRDLIFWFLPTEELFKAISPYSKLSYDPSALQKIADARTDILNKQKSDLGKTILTEKQQAEINKRKLILTPEELIRLGFKVTAKTIKYQNTVMHNNVPASLKIDISKKGTYSETIMDNPYLQLSGRSRPFYPVCMSDAGLTNKTFFYFDLRNKKQSVMQSSKDASERFYKSIDSLVPISISVKGMAEFRNPVVFWFPITEDFLNALPESAIEHLVIAKGLGETFEKSTQRKVDLSAINLIQLTTDQLQNIGVTQFTSEGILVAMSAFGKDNQLYMAYNKEGVLVKYGTIGNPDSAKFNTSDEKGQKQHMKIITVPKRYPSPSVVTDDIGHDWTTVIRSKEKVKTGDGEVITVYMNPPNNDSLRNSVTMYQINTYIPILVRSGTTYTNMDRIMGRKRPDRVLWYEPTEEFLEALPAEIAAEIRLEYKELLMPTPGNTKTCKYFEICRYSHGPLSEMKIYPNPVDRQLTVEGVLKEGRTLRVFVTDISGRIVNSGTEEVRGAKKFLINLNVESLSKGLYILIIETDKGERITERIMKN